MINYPFPCPVCFGFSLRDGEVHYAKMMPYKKPEPFFIGHGEECIYCPRCNWHSETASQRHERLCGEAERLEARLTEIEKQIGIAQYDAWVADCAAHSASYRIHQVTGRW